MAPQVTPLSNVDATWLKMEDPTNLMMVSGILTFARPIDMAYLRALIEYRLLQFDRFRQRVVQPLFPLTPAYWEDDPNFNINAHLHRIALPAPGDQTALQVLVSDLMSTPLDFSRPLWQFHVIDGFGEGSAIMVRLHHCIADGMALVGVLLALTDLSDNAPWPGPSEIAVENEDVAGRRASNHVLRANFQAMTQRARGTMKFGRRVGRRFLIAGLESYLDHDRPRQLVNGGLDYSYTLSKILLRATDPKTVFKGKLGVAKRAAWSRPIPLGEIKAIRKVLGGTVNDVLIASMTGGLRCYLEEKGEEVKGMDVTAIVPVNLRKAEEMAQLGNKFGLVFLSLPVGIENSRDRLVEVRKRMDHIKDSPEANVTLDVLNLLGVVPQSAQETFVGIIGARATAVLTNVPGPPIPLYLAGQPIEGLMFWVPQSGRLGMGISILSYAGNVYLGVATDAALVPDPEAIIEHFYEEHGRLLALATM
jgi:WS/DGAT/MGAT family acyltransferase